MWSRFPGRRMMAPLIAFVVAASCRETTAVANQHDLSLHRAHWAAHGLTKYTYVYETTGFFIATSGRKIHLVVINGAVQSATDVATGQPMDGPLTQWPTIDALFDRAKGADDAGLLRDIRFDPALEYPSEIDVGGPPDASGSFLASAVIPAP